MKKSFALLALVPFVLFSCQKEVAQNDIDTVVPTLDNGIPTVITCDINQEATKTQYAGNQTFGWTKDDRVRMPLVQRNDGGSITACDFFTFTTVCDNGSVSADFARNGDYAGEDLEEYDPNPSGSANTWTNMGYLIYPHDIFNKEQSGDYPVVELPNSYKYSTDGPLNSNTGVKVPMIGRKVGATYRFATAVGLIKVTISNIPANLTSVKLYSSDKSIAGKFAVSHSEETYPGSDIAIAQISNNSVYNEGGSNTVSLTTSSLTTGGTYSFYFPVPVGTYSANTLFIKLCTENGETVGVFSKKITKELTITRNEVLIVPELEMTYPRSISIICSKTCCPQINFNKSGSSLLRFNVSQDAEENLSAYIEGNKFSSGTEWAMAATSSPFASKVAALTSGGSGHYYLHYIFVDTTAELKDLGLSSVNDSHIIEYGTIPFYYFTPEVNFLVGTYYVNNNSNYVVTVQASDDESKGNLMITHYKGGTTYDVNVKSYGTYDAYNGTLKFNAASKSPEGIEYALVKGQNANSDISLSFDSHEKLLVGGELSLCQLVGETWTDLNHYFSSAYLVKH